MTQSTVIVQTNDNDRVLIQEDERTIRVLGPPAASTTLSTGGVPTKLDKSLTPLSTSGDGSPTSLTLSGTPKAGSYVTVSVNGVEYVVGDGVKTTDTYFSADGGTTAKAIASIVAGDELIWNAVLAGFDLLNSRDRVNFDYDL